MKTVFFCGETLQIKTVEKLFERFPDVHIINAYGPTEAACAVTSVRIEKSMLNDNSLPVGVIEKSAVEISVDYISGEISLSGNSVSEGYLNIESEKFACKNGKRCFSTGDIGRIENGYLYFHCRNDTQIKYKGFRIELSEIENEILKLPYISGAAVYVHYYNDRTVSSIKALVTTDDKRITAEVITKKLAKTLPEYMIPKTITLVGEIPVTENFKTSRCL